MGVGMKIQKGKMLIQNMKLKIGEIFQIGVGPKAFLMRFDGPDARGSKWDILTNVKKEKV
jgi:hypothetical protein